MAALAGGLLVLATTTALAAPPSKPHTAQKKGKGGKAPPKTPAPKAAASAPAVEAPLALALDVHRTTLENGLRVVVAVDHSAPTVAITLAYDVGARNEERGRSGFAHLFEHMMFQGSRNVAKGDHNRLIAGHGGELNGTTSSDRTSYYEVLPENELALGLWLEADRMRSLDVSQANFENQRKVVEEELRMRVTNAAYQPSEVRLEELVYEGYWPYEHPTIGSMSDLDGAELDWVQAFHAAHYGPNNAVLCIAGDVDPSAALSLARGYFEGIPKVAAPPFVDPGLPEQKSQRTAVIEDVHARSPGLLYGWAIPPARSADHYAIDVLAAVLAQGEGSRLHQILVRDKTVARTVAATTGQRRGPDMFRISAILSGGAKLADVEKLIDSELNVLATRGPTDAEVASARRRVTSHLLLGMQSNLARARRLGDYELFFGDARLLSGELPRYLAVTKDEVKRVAAQYLGPTRRTVVETLPVGHSAEHGDEAAHRTAPAPKSPAPIKDPGPKKGATKPKKHKKT
jgi:zinc protease